MGARFTELVIDCHDPGRVAAFWAAVLGYDSEGPDEDGEVELRDPSGATPTLLFVKVPEPKTVKNRLHIDVNPVAADQEEELERLLALGARRGDVGQGDEVDWIVLEDPEGNELCLLRSRLE